jgi:hypothetical protein
MSVTYPPEESRSGSTDQTGELTDVRSAITVETGVGVEALSAHYVTRLLSLDRMKQHQSVIG